MLARLHISSSEGTQGASLPPPPSCAGCLWIGVAGLGTDMNVCGG